MASQREWIMKRLSAEGGDRGVIAGLSQNFVQQLFYTFNTAYNFMQVASI